MDQARTTISKIFSGEPRSYTRFNLTQNMEGDNSQVEMKLSSDMDEEVEANGVETRNQHNGPYYTSKQSQRSPRNICLMVIGILLLFISGYLIGYLSHKSKGNIKTANCPLPEETVPLVADVPISLDWSDVRALLKEKLTINNIKSSLREFSRSDHQAGTSGDEALANNIMGKFQAFGMKPWTDEHFVKIDGPGASNNRVLFRGNAVGSTEGFLAYSAAGTVQGPALYAHYGRAEDFGRLQNFNVDVNGKVVLVRAGLLSFAEKVANAEKLNASAVLIYPDPLNYKIKDDTALFGHVHLGTGDPYTPGFPSFNHTQFPPARSSGLPGIPAQTITIKQATEIMRKMGGPDSRDWSDGQLRDVLYRLGDDGDVITVEVNNVLTEKKIHNVFGVIKGFVDADRYIVIGAQRDAWGTGYAKTTVGTSLLVELARTITYMVNDGFRPKRSIVFASWSAGEFGTVGATEWLEGYLTSLNMKVFSYIGLDEVISGFESFKATASPLLYELIKSTMKQVSSPSDPTKSLYDQYAAANWESSVMEPMGLSDSVYPFQAFSGIPSFSLRFTPSTRLYPFGTVEDTDTNLDRYTSYNTPKLAKAAGEVVGLVTLRLVHDHLIKLNVAQYTSVIRKYVSQISSKFETLQGSGRLPNALTMQWLLSALGSYDRAASALVSAIRNSDLDDMEQCRIINNRIMRVEGNLLSPYVSPRESLFRHIVLGSGQHTLAALMDHLNAFKEGLESANIDEFKNQLALATWTIQGCANALAGEVWDMDNEI